jgi:hypothetical protein
MKYKIFSFFEGFNQLYPLQKLAIMGIFFYLYIHSSQTGNLIPEKELYEKNKY